MVCNTLRVHLTISDRLHLLCQMAVRRHSQWRYPDNYGTHPKTHPLATPCPVSTDCAVRGRCLTREVTVTCASPGVKPMFLAARSLNTPYPASIVSPSCRPSFVHVFTCGWTGQVRDLKTRRIASCDCPSGHGSYVVPWQSQTTNFNLFIMLTSTQSRPPQEVTFYSLYRLNAEKPRPRATALLAWV